MNNKGAVRINASGTVNPQHWEQFEQMVLETKAIVKVAETGRVLLHECYYNADTCQIHIAEAYANEDAFLQHLELIRPLSEKFKVDWTINRLEMFGPYSTTVVEYMRGIYRDNIFFCYQSILAED